MSQAHSTLLLIIFWYNNVYVYVSHVRPTWPNGNRGKSIVRLWQSVYHNVPGSAPLRKHLNIFERNCLAVHEQSALWVMGAGLSKGHQGTAYRSSLRHFNIVLSWRFAPVVFLPGLERWRPAAAMLESVTACRSGLRVASKTTHNM